MDALGHVSYGGSGHQEAPSPCTNTASSGHIIYGISLIPNKKLEGGMSNPKPNFPQFNALRLPNMVNFIENINYNYSKASTVSGLASGRKSV
jgi:hypothetical protein